MNAIDHVGTDYRVGLPGLARLSWYDTVLAKVK